MKIFIFLLKGIIQKFYFQISAIETMSDFKENSSSEKKSCQDVVKQFFRKFTLEILCFLHGFGGGIIGVQLPTLYMEKVRNFLPKKDYLSTPVQACKVGSAFFGNQTYSNEVMSFYISKLAFLAAAKQLNLNKKSLG